MARARPELEPGVRFEPGFAARAARAIERRLRARAASELAGRFAPARAGEDWAGLRSWRPGDDPRSIDWSASARAEGALVRIARAPRGGLLHVALDASLSMAVGQPGKLQRAAEVAAALALGAVRAGGRARIAVWPAGERFELAHAAALPGLLARLERVRAAGRVELSAARLSRAARGVWIGDLYGLDPEQLARVAPGGVPFAVLQIAAPCEIAPGEGAPVGPGLAGAVAWWEPESDAWLELELDARALAAHARALEARHAALARVLARRGAPLARASSAEPFEAILARLPWP
jgi:uncharacterized protein (DUF58 family)